MRKTVKFLHTLGSSGLLGGLLSYVAILFVAPQETAAEYASMRQAISAVSMYLIVPSLAVVLVSGLLSMAVHRPFQQQGWAWIKLLMGLVMFEATLAIVHSKAMHAAETTAKWTDAAPARDALAQALAYEWHSLAVVTLLSAANILLGVWRPRIKRLSSR